MKWSQSSQSWTDPSIVSTNPSNTHCIAPNTCFKTMVTANYVPVFWQCGPDPNNQNIYFAKIVLDSTGIGPPRNIEWIQD